MDDYMICRHGNLVMNYGGDVDFNESTFEGPFTIKQMLNDRRLIDEINEKWVPEIEELLDERINLVKSEKDLYDLITICIEEETYTMGHFDVITKEEWDEIEGYDEYDDYDMYENNKTNRGSITKLTTTKDYFIEGKILLKGTSISIMNESQKLFLKGLSDKKVESFTKRTPYEANEWYAFRRNDISGKMTGEYYIEGKSYSLSSTSPEGTDIVYDELYKLDRSIYIPTATYLDKSSLMNHHIISYLYNNELLSPPSRINPDTVANDVYNYFQSQNLFGLVESKVGSYIKELHVFDDNMFNKYFKEV